MIDTTSPLTDADWLAIGQYGTLHPYQWCTPEGD
jgi:hypothetical protein